MQRPRILIVDDEKDAREIIRNFLNRHIECSLQEASSGRQALELIDKQDFDLLLLDVKMPGISGVDVLKKSKLLHPDTDVLMITAYDSPQVAREVLKEGATDFIIKPSTIEVIFEKAVDILKKRNQYLPKEE
jgi:DNA-binding NtrC family response regulator